MVIIYDGPQTTYNIFIKKLKKHVNITNLLDARLTKILECWLVITSIQFDPIACY